MHQLREFMLWALRKRRPWRVQGNSMKPDYSPGDLVLIDPDATAHVGDVVVARHPFKNVEVIKYVASVDADDHVVLRSPAGDDSRQFGRVPVHTIRGVATYNWKKNRSS